MPRRILSSRPNPSVVQITSKDLAGPSERTPILSMLQQLCFITVRPSLLEYLHRYLTDTYIHKYSTIKTKKELSILQFHVVDYILTYLDYELLQYDGEQCAHSKDLRSVAECWKKDRTMERQQESTRRTAVQRTVSKWRRTGTNVSICSASARLSTSEVHIQHTQGQGASGKQKGKTSIIRSWIYSIVRSHSSSPLVSILSAFLAIGLQGKWNVFRSI